jgi:hypothetical protein
VFHPQFTPPPPKKKDEWEGAQGSKKGGVKIGTRVEGMDEGGKEETHR